MDPNHHQHKLTGKSSGNYSTTKSHEKIFKKLIKRQREKKPFISHDEDEGCGFSTLMNLRPLHTLDETEGLS